MSLRVWNESLICKVKYLSRVVNTVSVCCGEEDTAVDHSAPEPLTLKESKLVLADSEDGEDNYSMISFFNQ